MMRLSLPDLCDAYPDAVHVAEPMFNNYGGNDCFSGEIATVTCFEDNSVIAARVEEPGRGRVMVVDAGGSLRCGVLGDNLAQKALDNGWAGLIVYGCIRDVDIIETLEEESKDLTADLLAEIEADTLATDTSANSLSFEEFANENPLYALLYPNVDQQNQLNSGPVVGFCAVKDTAALNVYLKDDAIRKFFPVDVKFAYTVKPYDPDGKFVQLVALKSDRNGKSAMEGDVVTDAVQVFGQFASSAEVSMEMNAEGAKQWKRLTAENIKKSVAIVLDGYVYSYPTVQAEIAGGRSSITGNFTVNEAKDLANILKSGKLPAPARIIEEAIVGPSLGEEAISSGLTSFIFALLLVLAYMIFYYNGAGVVSNIALLANIFFIFGVLSSLGAVLTLPGIAGIILTIGMSVDANVLIYERIREELRNGKGLRLAIEDGYNNAYSSIIDANVTTLLTAIVLKSFGSGAIESFATTLIIGIFTSVFAALVITRLCISWWLKSGKTINFESKLTKNAFKNFKIDFVGKRKSFYILSAVLVIGSIAAIFTRELSPSVEFSGGHSYTIKFDNSTEGHSNLIKANLNKVLVDENGKVASTTVKTKSNSFILEITTNFKKDGNPNEEVKEKIEEGLSLSESKVGKAEIQESRSVTSSISDELLGSSMLAVAISLLIIFAYILLRFGKWQYSTGAIIAMAHDVTLVLGIFALFHGILPFNMDIDQAFVAAILTVIGYSINDTVIVFDRIRENLRMNKNTNENDEINRSLNSTLSRTINTSMTTFIVLLIIFLFGGGAIKGFIFALMIGVIVGTYSSVCIATPILIDFSKKSKKGLKEPEPEVIETVEV